VAYTPQGEHVGRNFYYPHLPMATNNFVSRHNLEIDARTKTIDIRPRTDGQETYHPIEEYNNTLKNWSDYFNVETRWDQTLTKIEHQKQLLTFKDGSELK